MAAPTLPGSIAERTFETSFIAGGRLRPPYLRSLDAGPNAVARIAPRPVWVKSGDLYKLTSASAKVNEVPGGAFTRRPGRSSEQAEAIGFFGRRDQLVELPLEIFKALYADGAVLQKVCESPGIADPVGMAWPIGYLSLASARTAPGASV